MQAVNINTVARKTILFISAICLGTSFIQGQSVSVSQNTRNDERVVLQTERELLRARIEGDENSLNRLLAENYISFDGLTKQDVIKDLKPMLNTSFDTSSLKADLKSDSANVTAVLVRNLPPFGDTYWRVVDNLRKHSGQWQSVSTRRAMLPIWNGKRYIDSDMKMIPALSCRERSGMKSLNSDKPTMLKFTNTMSQPVIVRWLNYNGELAEEPYLINTIPAGDSMTIMTFVTHPFLVTDKAGTCLRIFKPNPEPSLAIIK